MKAAILTIVLAAATLTACNTNRNAASSSPLAAAEASTAVTMTDSSTVFTPKALPKAIVYRTNGDYYHNVPVTLNAARTEIVSWPAPGDINDSQLPVRYAEGWMLDRRGINANTAFLDYTYKEYRKLPATLGRAELMSHIIPEARVTEMRELPIPLWKAIDDPVEASKLVDDSKVIYVAQP